jgi:hypothetical protein
MRYITERVSYILHIIQLLHFMKILVRVNIVKPGYLEVTVLRRGVEVLVVAGRAPAC